MPKKPSEKAIMDALTAKAKAISTGAAAPAPRVQAPKMPKPVTRKAAMIDVALKQAIRKSGRSYYDLGRACDVDPSVVVRFMADPETVGRGGDMRLSTAAKLAAELGLRLG